MTSKEEFDRSWPIKKQLMWFRGSYRSIEVIIEAMGYETTHQLYLDYVKQTGRSMPESLFLGKIKQLSCGDIESF